MLPSIFYSPSPCSTTSSAPPLGVLQAYASLLGVALWKGHSAAAASYGFSANNVWVAILNTLAFSTPALPRLYAYVTANVKVRLLPTHKLKSPF
jgi:hypothetical protein